MVTLSIDPTADVRNGAFVGFLCDVSPVAMSPGSVFVCEKSLRIPPRLPSGDYYLGAYADYSFMISETNRLNNGFFSEDPIRISALDWSDTIGLYNAVTGSFHLRNRAHDHASVFRLTFGPAPSSWLPLAGDWNGDGRVSLGLYDATTGLFHLRDELADGACVVSLRFGPTPSTLLPLAGDWNGDGKSSIGLYNPATGIFHLRSDLRVVGRPTVTTSRFGVAGSQTYPIAGDWNGDGRWSVGLYHRTSGVFHLLNDLEDDTAVTTLRFGPAPSTLLPVVGDWTDQGRSSLGLYSRKGGVFHLRSSLDDGAVIETSRFGPAPTNWIPLSGP